MNTDQKFFFFIKKWAEERKCTFDVESCDGRESPEWIDGMAVDDVWGWLLPEGVSEHKDEYYGCLEWKVEGGKLQLHWNTERKNYAIEESLVTIEFLRFLIARILEYAHEATADMRADMQNEFKSGRQLAYYEVLDVIQAEAEAHGLDLKELGLDLNLDRDL